MLVGRGMATLDSILETAKHVMARSAPPVPAVDPFNAELEKLFAVQPNSGPQVMWCGDEMIEFLAKQNGEEPQAFVNRLLEEGRISYSRETGYRITSEAV